MYRVKGLVTSSELPDPTGGKRTSIHRSKHGVCVLLHPSLCGRQQGQTEQEHLGEEVLVGPSLVFQLRGEKCMVSRVRLEARPGLRQGEVIEEMLRRKDNGERAGHTKAEETVRKIIVHDIFFYGKGRKEAHGHQAETRGWQPPTIPSLPPTMTTNKVGHKTHKEHKIS